jgi:hypothetical protein
MRLHVFHYHIRTLLSADPMSAGTPGTMPSRSGGIVRLAMEPFLANRAGDVKPLDMLRARSVICVLRRSLAAVA